jgi:signal transduction histidine kinase
VPLGEITIEFSGGEGFLDPEGQRAGLALLAGMLVSFAFIRFSTRMIRAEVSWWPGNVTPGGLHIHHLVFGIVLMMLAGFLGFVLQPESPWLEIIAAAFGVGVGLTLDEFALWLYLEDVYWSEEGRRSVDAVVFAAIIGGALVLGFTPVSSSDGSILVSIAILLVTCLIAALKGKFWSTVIGMFVPVVAMVAAIRLARPGSPWARRRYDQGSAKLAKAEAREQKHNRRRQRLLDLVGGAPSLPSPRAGRDDQD